MPDQNSATSLEDRKLAYEERKLVSDITLRKLELKIRARESGWATKLFSPLTAGVLALAGSAVGALIQANNGLKLEHEKEQHELILKMISVPEIEQAKENVQFLAETGLIDNRELANKILSSKTTPLIPPQNTAPYVLSAPTGCNITVNPGETLQQAIANWAIGNIEQVDVPQLGKIQGGSQNTKVLFNVRAAAALRAAWAEIEQRGLLERVTSWDGGYNPRPARGGARLSGHACGLAFDINAAYNNLGQTPAQTGQVGSVIELVPIFERHGFFWGGNSKRPDGMHFEYVLPESPASATSEKQSP